MTEAQRALAKDWNVIKRQMEWSLERQVEQYNLLVQHDVLLETWKKWLWISSILLGGSTGTGLLWWFLGHASKAIGGP